VEIPPRHGPGDSGITSTKRCPKKVGAVMASSLNSSASTGGGPVWRKKVLERWRRKLHNIIDSYISLFLDFTCQLSNSAQEIKRSMLIIYKCGTAFYMNKSDAINNPVLN
jgi:hypothetical protein